MRLTFKINELKDISVKGGLPCLHSSRISFTMRLHHRYLFAVILLFASTLAQSTKNAEMHDSRDEKGRSRMEHRSDEGEDYEEFCRGMPMIMFMDGFHSSTRRINRCLSYFVGTWILNEQGKFRGAMAYSFLLALLLEGLTALRVTMLRHGRKVRLWTLPLIYMFQALLGYLIMYVAMSFSLELLFSVIAGLMVGNVFFVRMDVDMDSAKDVVLGPSQCGQRTPESPFDHSELTTPLLQTH